MEREFTSFRSGAYRLMATIDLPDKVAFLAGGEPLSHRVPAVIFCHGFTGNRIESRRMYARLGAKLAELGIASFRFDHRGCGESDGDFVDFTPEGMLEDLDAALKGFLSSRWLDRNRLAVVGYSLGGTSASYLLNKYPEFVTAVMWAPVARPGILRERLSQHPDFDGYEERGYMDYAGFRISRSYLQELDSTINPIQWTKGFRGSILFCHGEDDDVVPPEHSLMYIDARKNAGDTRFLVPNGDHGFGSAANIDLVLDRSSKWLSEQLIGRERHAQTSLV